MSDFRPILERARDRFGVPHLSLEEVFRRSDRRRRDRRLAAAAAGVAIGLVGILVGRSIVTSFESPANHVPAPAPEVRNGPLVTFTLGRGS